MTCAMDYMDYVDYMDYMEQGVIVTKGSRKVSVYQMAL